jgi:hypothetical protein
LRLQQKEDGFQNLICQINKDSHILIAGLKSGDKDRFLELGKKLLNDLFSKWLRGISAFLVGRLT